MCIENEKKHLYSKIIFVNLNDRFKALNLSNLSKDISISGYSWKVWMYVICH